MERSETCDGIVLDAARIAADLLAGCTPSEEAVFALAARMVAVDPATDPLAPRLALELTSGLLDHIPDGRAWSETRGRIWACRLFAWLLARPPGQDRTDAQRGGEQTPD